MSLKKIRKFLIDKITFAAKFISNLKGVRVFRISRVLASFQICRCLRVWCSRQATKVCHETAWQTECMFKTCSI